MVGASVVVAAPSRHSAVHWAPSPTFFLSDTKRTLRPFLAAFPVRVTASGTSVPQNLHKNNKLHLGRIILVDFSILKFNLRLSSENKFVSLSATFGISIWKIETGAGKSDSVLAFFGSLVLDRTLGFRIVCVTILIIGIEGKRISGRKDNLFHLALSLWTGVV